MPAPPSPPLDPALLATFRREAAAIIAQERGLTPAGRMRLAQAAKNAGLADDQVDEAIRSFSAAEPAAPPSAAAERFRERLRKDLSVKSRPILGPTLETKILSAADRKFGLSEALAGEILGQVAAELGLTRITASDAISSLAAQIDQAAGTSTWLAREAWDRLRSAGTKWGLDLEVIDAMIDERLAANRTDSQRRQFWTKATLVSAIGAVAAAAVILAGLTIARWQSTGRRQNATPATAPPQPLVESMLSTPAWWDVPLSVEVATARGRRSASAEVLALISSTRPDDRTRGYERLVEAAARAEKPDVRTDLERIVAGCLALETDPNAVGRLQTALAALLPAASAPLPDDETALDRSLWAARTFGLALERAAAASERQTDLLRTVTDAIGPVPLFSADNVDRHRLLREQTIRAWYAQLAAAAPQQPTAVAEAYPFVAARAESILDEESLLEADTSLLLSALPKAGDEWRTYRRAIGRIVSSPDPLRPLRLVETLRKTTNSELADYLTRLLVARSGAEPRSLARKDVVIAVRKALAGGSAGLSLADRWLVLEEEVAAALTVKPSASPEPILRELVHLTHLTTLAVALAQGEAGLATFDARIAAPPELESTSLASFSRASAATEPPRLTKEQQRELSACLDDLAKTTPATKPAREAAWRRLAILAKDLPDIPPSAAAQIATQALAPHDQADFPRRLPLLAQLRTWNRFRLAVADKLANSRLPARQHDLVQSLTGTELRPDAASADLHYALLASVLHELPPETGTAIAGELLDAVEDRLQENHLECARLLGVSPAAIAPGANLAQLAEQCLLKIAADPSRSQHEIVAARHVAATDEIRFLAALQTPLIAAAAQRLSARQPARALAARRLAADATAAAATAADVWTQLRDQQRTLLQLWMLDAPEA